MNIKFLEKIPVFFLFSILSVLFLSHSLKAAFPARISKINNAAGAVKFKKHIVPHAKRPFKRKLTKKERKTLRNFKSRHGRNFILYRNPSNLAPALLSGQSKVKYGGAPREAALKFIAENKNFLGINPAELKYEPRYSKKGPLGIWHIYFRQVHEGLEVIGADVTVHLKDGQVIFHSSSFAGNITVSLTSGISAVQAEAKVTSESAKPTGKPKLALFSSADGNVYLVWKVRAVKPTGTQKGVYLVDAHTGEILLFYSSRAYVAAGNIKGEIYETFPNIFFQSPYPPYGNYVQKNIPNQYVWARSYQNRTSTNAGGNYSFGINGKIFTALEGPYFSVVNQGGTSAYYVSAAANWSDKSTIVDLPSGTGNYDNNMVYSSTVSPALSETYVLSIVPIFDANFSVGEMDRYGLIVDSDNAVVQNPADANRTLALYRGGLTNGVFGPFVPNNSYIVKLNTNNEGQSSGFTITNTKVLYFPLSSSPATDGVASSYNLVWDASHTSVNSREEVNTFYHLNEMRRFFQNGVNVVSLSATSGTVVGLNSHIPVIVRASGNDLNEDGMWNAFYDLEDDYIMIGAGPEDFNNPGMRLSFAYDAALIRHEYVHGVIDRIFPIWYFGESGAVSEALSDYWALSSLRDASAPYTPKLTSFGEFFSTGLQDPTIERNLKDDCGGTQQNCLVYPDDWVSEVHDDGRIIGQILWSMRDPSMTATWLGDMTAFNGYTGPRSDLFIWHALLFFPDTMYELKEAITTVCRQMEGTTTCNTNYLPKINLAFSRHGVVNPTGGDIYEPNDGPDDAADISGLTELSATIYADPANGGPSYDTDYYSIPLAPGKFRVTMTLPPSQFKNYYHAYMMILLSPDRKDLQTAYPTIANSLSYCPDTGECRTREQTVTLEYDIQTEGRYILMVSAGPNFYFFNGPDYSLEPYHLKFDYDADGSANAQISSAVYDNDVINYTVAYSKFFYNNAPYWDSTLTGEVEKYHYTQLLDQDLNPLPGADTLAATYVQDTGIPSLTTTHISGQVRLNPGFHSRYPAAGTVYLKIYGITREGAVVALGISDAVNLTENTTNAIVWNNILNLNTGEKAIITFSIQQAGNVSIKLYTRNGFKVKDIYNGYAAAGMHSVSWSGRNAEDAQVASGMYLLVVEIPGLKEVKKIVVVK